MSQLFSSTSSQNNRYKHCNWVSLSAPCSLLRHWPHFTPRPPLLLSFIITPRTRLYIFRTVIQNNSSHDFCFLLQWISVFLAHSHLFRKITQGGELALLLILGHRSHNKTKTNNSLLRHFPPSNNCPTIRLEPTSSPRESTRITVRLGAPRDPICVRN